MSASDLTNATWRKSTRSTANGECVEVASAPSIVALRDSKDPQGPLLTVDPAAFAAFTAVVKDDSSR